MLTGLRSHILLRQQESLPRQSEFKQGICSTTRTDACNICGQSQRKFRREVKFDGTFRARTNLSTWRESLSQTKDKIDVALWAVHCHERNKAPDRDSSSRSCPILSETGEISNNGNWMKKTPTLRLECDICYNSMLMLARYTREVRKQKTICHQWAQPYEGRQKKKKKGFIKWSSKRQFRPPLELCNSVIRDLVARQTTSNARKQGQHLLHNQWFLPDLSRASGTEIVGLPALRASQL